MLDVLSSTKPIVQNSTEVKINRAKIKELASEIKREDLGVSEINLSRYSWGPEDLVSLVFLFNIVNFAYWAKKSQEKWAVIFEGKELDGSVAMFRCLEEELKRNPDFLAPDSLADLSRLHLKKILKGNVVIPLFEERLSNIVEVGRILENKFPGGFLDIYRAAENDAYKLAELLVAEFPSFDDVSEFNGQTVAFYKRAQLNSKMVSDALVSCGREPLVNMDKLTTFADYKIPQILRRLGIIEYSSKLADKIDSYELIAPHSKEEIEIRANDIWAIEFIKQELKPRFEFVTSSHVDCMLWLMSQKKVKGEKPYHRILTTAY